MLTMVLTHEHGRVLLFGGWIKVVLLRRRVFGGPLHREEPPLYRRFTAPVDISQPLKYSWNIVTRVTLLSTFVSVEEIKDGERWIHIS